MNAPLSNNPQGINIRIVGLLGLLFFLSAEGMAQYAPAGIGTSSENVLWLRSDQGTSTTTNGEPVSGWNDISGNANHAAQGTAGNQPIYISSGINGLPTIRFDGTNDHLTVADADNLDNTNGVSVFVIAQPVSPDALARGLVSKRVSAGNEEAFYLFTYTGRNLYFNASTYRINGNDPVTDQPQIFSAIYDGSVANPRSKIFYNGEESGNGNGPVSIANMASDLHIGILNPGYAQAFNGDISEIIVYRDNLNKAQRLIVEAYLANRYNIAITPTSYSSTTHTQDFIGIGHSGGDRYSQTRNVGSGLLLSERNETLDETNEFVFAGHDGTPHGFNTNDLPTIPGVNLDQRWDRIYYVERVQNGVIDAGSTDVRITFDFTEAGLSLSTDRVYYLLYRSGTSGTFSSVPGGTGVASNGKVSINLSSSNFASGYYTLARSDQQVKTWYSLNDGNWNDYETWSLKPNEPDNPSHEIPGIMDRAVIQNNKTITVTTDDTQCGILDVIDGIVDFGTTTGSTFSTITGQVNGKIRLAADNFPSGDAGEFADASSGGTVEYYGTGYNLSTSRTFRNMVVNLTNTTNKLYLLSNYTLNGSLTITRGEFYFGDNVSTTSRSLTVYGDFVVEANGKVHTGSANARHQLNLYGDFTNRGNIQLTNRAAADYTAEATDGIVDANFLSATRNQSMLLYGPTRFYRIAISKGLSSTYELYMWASSSAYFELFGYANEGHPDEKQLLVNNNSLGLAYGTVRVGANITVPRLNGGGNYNVSENAILWVDGGTVTKPSGTAVVVYGKVKVSAGTFNANINSGITTRLNGVFESTGGTTNLGQFRTSVYGTQHIGGFIQSGGNVTVDQAYGSSSDYYLFSLSYEGNIFTLTGGTLHIKGTNAKGSVFINSDPVNQNVSTNATLILESTSTSPFRITSRAPFPNVTMSRSGSGTRTLVLEGGIVGSNPGNQAELPALPLVTKGTLTINDNVVFDAKGQDVTIGRSYSIGSGANYIAASNTTTFQGASQNYIIAINAAATTKYFHNLTINNNGYTGTLSVSDITVGNNLTITEGSLATGAKTVTVRGNIINSDTIKSTSGGILITNRGIVNLVTVTNGGSYTSVPTVTIAAPGGSGIQATAVAIFNGTPSGSNPLPVARIAITNTGSGYTSAPTVSFSAGAATATASISTTHELGGNGNGVFGSLELNEPHPSEASEKVEVTYLSANQSITDTLAITDGVLDIKAKSLTLDGYMGSETLTDYSPTKMIRTSGNHSDLGMSRRITSNATYIYPLGIYTKTGDGSRYTPISQAFTSVSDTGYVQLNNVDSELPTLAPSAESALQYYWRVRHSGFSTIPEVYNIFYFYNLPDGYRPGMPDPATSWGTGKIVEITRYYNLGPLSWDNPAKDLSLEYSHQESGQTGSSPPELQEGEFTTGHNTRFAGTVQVFYLRQNGNWRTNATWSFTRGGAPADDYPKQGDIAVIRRFSVGYNGIVEITNAETCAKVIFDDENGFSSGCPRVQFSNSTAYGSNFAVVEVAETHQGGTPLDGERHGAVIKYDLYDGYAGEFPSGDFGDFNRYPNALVIYTKEGASSEVTLSSSATEYPQVWFDPPANRTFILPDTLVTFNGMVIVTYGHTLRMNTGSSAGATFKRRLNIGHSYGTGYFDFAGNASANQTVTAETNINLYNNAQLRINAPAGIGRTHLLKLHGNMTMETGCSVNLGDGNPANTNVTLELTGNGTNSLTGAGTASLTLSRVTMNKGTSQAQSFSFSWPFSLTGPTSGATTDKALQLQNGTLYLNNAGININLSTGGGDFYIPSTSGLVVKNGKVNVSGNDNGILLDGLLRVETGGTINMDGGAGVNNYIEYSASGNATLEVIGGTLTVGSQIRRGTTNPSGILRYTQTGGTVVVGKNAAPVANRGTFEVLNTGSRFIHTGGTLTVARPQTSATEATILLEPTVASIGNTTLQVGSDDTPASSVLTLKSTMELGNLTIAGVNSPTLRLKDRSLTLKGDLTIGSNCTFDGAGSFNLTSKRHIVNNGMANLNVDTLFMAGSSSPPSSANQQITGNVRARNLIVEPETSVSLQPLSELEVDANLHIISGQLVDGANRIVVKGNVTNNSSHVSSNPVTGGIVFNGTSLQRIYGNGEFGRIEVDNPNGVQLENSIAMENNLAMTSGILQLQSNKLTLGLNAAVEGSGFDSTKMIAVGGGDYIQGIEKAFPTVPSAVPSDPYDPDDPAYTFSFTFPIGVDNGTDKKYTPVELHVASNATQGTVNLFPVNKKHITFDETQTDVLQYYWIMNSSGLSNFTSVMRMHYINGDVVGDESAYIGAKLYDNFWAKFQESEVPPIEVVYENDDFIAFITDGVNLITGEYTAGIESHIPNEVPLYYSKQNGEWTNSSTWEREDGGLVPVGGPVGQRVHIRTSHTVSVSSNYRRAYRTTINGRLELDSTKNHILGYVSGTGTLSTEISSLPSGSYDTFFACGTGGTMEWAGGTYGLPSSITSYYNITITGTGTKTFPNYDITICGDLRIDSSATLKQPGVPSDYRYTTIKGNTYLLDSATWDMGNRTWVNLEGNFTRDDSTSFLTSYTNQTFKVNGTTDQAFIGVFNSNNQFNTLHFDNTGNISFNDSSGIRNYLYMNNGHIQNPAGKPFMVAKSDGDGFYAYSNGLFEGSVSINLNSSSPKQFLPVGKNGIKKFIYPLDLPLTVGFWIGEYFNSSPSAHIPPMRHDSLVSPLQSVSQSEYWRISGPNGVSSRIKLTLDGTSDIASGISDINNLRIVYWNGTKWEIAGTGATITGNASSGTISTTASFTFNGAEQFFTLGAIESVVVPTAQITSSDAELCEGSTYQLVIALTGNSPWFIDYNDGTTSYHVDSILSSPHTINITGMITGSYTYAIDTVRDKDSVLGYIYGPNPTVNVYVNPTQYIVTSGGNICGPTTTTIELNGSDVGFTYQLYRDAVYFGTELAGTGSALTFTGVDQSGTYTVRAFNDLNSSCYEWMNGSPFVDYAETPQAEVTGLISPSQMCEGEPVEIEITLTGVPPFTFSVADNHGGSWLDITVDVGELSGSGPYTYNFTTPNQLPTWSDPALPKVYHYNVTAITDDAGCGPGTVVGPGVDVDVYKIPETGPQYHIPNNYAY